MNYEIHFFQTGVYPKDIWEPMNGMAQKTLSLQKERLTNDVRYQEFREITLDCFEGQNERSRVISFSILKKNAAKRLPSNSV